MEILKDLVKRNASEFAAATAEEATEVKDEKLFLTKPL